MSFKKVCYMIINNPNTQNHLSEILTHKYICLHSESDSKNSIPIRIGNTMCIHVT